MDTGIYSIKWFLQCFLDRLPFSLTLRVWDVFLLEGDCIILAMAYNILKLHQKSLLKMDMDQLMEFLQKTLPNDFGYEDDVSMECLKDCLGELKSSKLISGGPLSETELPQKQFGYFDPDEFEIEMRLEEGARSAVTERERDFHRNTLQREQDNMIKLRHIDSQDSLDNDDEEEEEDEDASLTNSVSFEGDLSDRSLENEELTPPIIKNHIKRQISKTVSWKELDESVEYLLKQADLPDSHSARPLSAGPLPTASHLCTTVTTHQRPCSSAGQISPHVTSTRFVTSTCLIISGVRSPNQPEQINRSTSRASGHSCSSSSREINISTDSQRSLSSHQSRPPSKSSYYFGESPTVRQSPLTPEMRAKPKSRYLYGADPDLQEILHNCNNYDEVVHEVKTPVNEPVPTIPQVGRQEWNQERGPVRGRIRGQERGQVRGQHERQQHAVDNRQEKGQNRDYGRQERGQERGQGRGEVRERLLTQEHNMRLLASAGASPPSFSPNRSRTRSAIPRPISDRHKTFSVLNSRVLSQHSPSDRQGQVRGQSGVSSLSLLLIGQNTQGHSGHLRVGLQPGTQDTHKSAENFLSSK